MTDHRSVIRPNPRLARLADRQAEEASEPDPRIRRSARGCALVIGAIALLVCVAIAFAVTRGPQPAHAARPAPGFDLVALNGDGQVRLADHLGTPVLINFWASWCTPCREEMPELEQLSQELRGQLVVIGIDMNDDPSKARSLATDLNITYPLAVDESSDVVRAYDVTVVPSSMFVASDGTLVARSSGKPSRAQLEEMLAEYFGIRFPTATPTSDSPPVTTPR